MFLSIRGYANPDILTKHAAVIYPSLTALSTCASCYLFPVSLQYTFRKDRLYWGERRYCFNVLISVGFHSYFYWAVDKWWYFDLFSNIKMYLCKGNEYESNCTYITNISSFQTNNFENSCWCPDSQYFQGSPKDWPIRTYPAYLNWISMHIFFFDISVHVSCPFTVCMVNVLHMILSFLCLIFSLFRGIIS